MTADLEEERDTLLGRIRALDDEYAAGELDETDYANLREDYAARAAAVLRQLASPRSTSSDDVQDVRLDDVQDDEADDEDDGELPSRHPSGRRRTRRRTRLAAAAILVAMVAGGSGLALAGSAKKRTATDQATGSLPEGTTDRVTRAQVLVSEGKVLEAVRVYDDLLKDDPENPVALAERGWLLSRVDPTLVDSGLASIERAIALDPTFPEAHFFRGMILLRAKGEPALAAEAFQRAIDAKPPADVIATLEGVKAQALAEAAGGPTSSTTAPAQP